MADVTFPRAPEDPSHPGRNTTSITFLRLYSVMPVCNPCISVNRSPRPENQLNYQIMPFITYLSDVPTGLTRSDEATKFAALDTAISNRYKPLDKTGSTPTAPQSTAVRSI
jgi:hypothetical protein